MAYANCLSLFPSACSSLCYKVSKIICDLFFKIWIGNNGRLARHHISNALLIFASTNSVADTAEETSGRPLSIGSQRTIHSSLKSTCVPKGLLSFVGVILLERHFTLIPLDAALDRFNMHLNMSLSLVRDSPLLDERFLR